MAGPAQSSSDGARHFLILDALRFVLAFWVVLAHTGLPPIFDIIHPTGAVGHLIVQIYHSLVYGMTAVMASSSSPVSASTSPSAKANRSPSAASTRAATCAS